VILWQHTGVRRLPSAAAAVTAAILCACLVGCQHEPSAAELARGPERRFELTGKVVSIDRSQREVTIAHDEIPGFMSAMTMPFSLKDEWAFDVLAPGDAITATLVVQSGMSWLEGIVVSKPGGAPPATSGTGGLREPAIGGRIPPFSLVNQNGQRISLERYRDRALLVTFIYTRCPLPDQCPLMTDNFAKVYERLRRDPSLATTTRLLAITLDPEFDTPPVLRAYADDHLGSDTSRAFDLWDFATGSGEEIRRVADAFGLSYSAESGEIVHALRTAVIAPDGTFFKLYRGNDWTVDDVMRDLADATRG
jgi:protein SCO1/2